MCMLPTKNRPRSNINVLTNVSFFSKKDRIWIGWPWILIGDNDAEFSPDSDPHNSYPDVLCRNISLSSTPEALFCIRNRIWSSVKAIYGTVIIAYLQDFRACFIQQRLVLILLFPWFSVSGFIRNFHHCLSLVESLLVWIVSGILSAIELWGFILIYRW